MPKHPKEESLLKINNFLQGKEEVKVEEETFKKLMFIYSVAMKELVTNGTAHNIKSAKKRVKVNSVKALNNQMAKSELKTTLKKFDAAIAGGDKAEATAAYTTAVKAVDQAAAKHLLHKNNASNKKSKMTTKLNGMA